MLIPWTLVRGSKPTSQGFRKTLDSLDLDVTNRERMHLCLFQFSLCDQASNWLECLPSRSASTWKDLTTCFLAKFFPPGKTAKLQNDIIMFQQHQDESLPEAWTHKESLGYKNPNIKQLLGVMECKVDMLMKNAMSLMGSSKEVSGMTSDMMRQLPPKPSHQEAFKDLMMNFILDQEEKIKQLQEYMSVIGSDFIDYGVVGDDYEGPLMFDDDQFDDDYERPLVFNNDQFEDELEIRDEAFVLIGKEVTPDSKIPEAIFPLLEEFLDVFPDELPEGLMSPGEHEEFHRQVKELLSKGHARKRMSPCTQPCGPLELISLHVSGFVPTKVKDFVEGLPYHGYSSDDDLIENSRMNFVYPWGNDAGPSVEERAFF
uniref:Putative reverse transcriptase domain-containing protein n=1 Tax=Tanacetum cinerariifolium TaxID=118510 RepID=A0A6L2K0T3_TANCI|nr:putative reverse transcriptase domain-containing protein [Tanacetum cinerariifolium]